MKRLLLPIIILIQSGCAESPPDLTPSEISTDHQLSTMDQKVLLNIPGWPTVFEINQGETFHVLRHAGGKGIERDIRLVDIQEFREPDYFTGASNLRTLRMAEVTLEVSGFRKTLLCRPYQMPELVNGLRIYVEATKAWANEAKIEVLPDMKSDVRISVVSEGEGWGPASLVFPIQNYRWQSSTYRNTWLSLVPYNLLYYHRGEDFGAVPGHLPVVSALTGKIITSPIPDGDGRSNNINIEAPSGIRVEYYHMDIDNIDAGIWEGAEVKAGTVLGKTGMTWAGKKQQVKDPHLHFSIGYGSTNISPYPMIVEAYFREYPDQALAVAGNFHFTIPGQPVLLDGSRSVARPGQSIESYEWRLHTGEVVHSPVTQMTYGAPGLYSEELIIRTSDGHETKDFAQVRVYDDSLGPESGKEMVRGWAHHRPVRGIKPGLPVTLWNRLAKAPNPVQIDFGDQSPPQTIDKEILHSYEKPGNYTVTLTTFGADNQPATLKMQVIVEEHD